jgi:PilZ domain
MRLMEPNQDRKSPRESDDRRAAVRHDSRQFGTILVRVLGRCDARLIDVSRRGVLFDSEARLTIGAKTTIRITTTDTSVALKGTVVRSRVVLLGKVIIYQTALQLDEDLTLVTALDDETLASSSLLALDPQLEDSSVDGVGNILAANGDVLAGEQVEFVANVSHDLRELQRRAIGHDDAFA